MITTVLSTWGYCVVKYNFGGGSSSHLLEDTMPVYIATAVVTNKDRVGETNPDRQVLVGSIIQEPITLEEYKAKYPCQTKWWNTSNQCEDLQS